MCVCPTLQGLMNFTHRDEEVNYFPSRFDPVRHSERYPIASTPLGGKREKAIIFKENNFAQPGARFRSFDAARQERFLGRLSEMLLDERCTQEIRRIWGACALTSTEAVALALLPLTSVCIPQTSR